MSDSKNFWDVNVDTIVGNSEPSVMCDRHDLTLEVLNQENRLTLVPGHVEFKVGLNSNATKFTSEQRVKVCNRSKNTVLCRFSHLLDPNCILPDKMNIIQVKSVALCRLHPAMIVDYLVTFKPAALSNPKTYRSLEGVQLVFETLNDDRLSVKRVFYVPVKFTVVKPEPELITKTIIFPPVDNLGANINLIKYLIMKNNGDADCVFSVLEEYQKIYRDSDNLTSHSAVINVVNSAKNDTNIFREIIESIVHKMFTYFTWKNHTSVLLPSKGSVKIPVVFNQTFVHSTVSECYVIAFDNTEYEIPNQTVNVIGHVKELMLLVEPDTIDIGPCYLTSFVHFSFRVQNISGTVVPFKIRIPRELSRYVELDRSRKHLKAGSAVKVFVCLCPKYDIMQSKDCKAYFDTVTGLLEFPIWVCPSNSKTFCEVRVSASVTTSLGLKLSPDLLDFGTVNTMETVVRSFTLANHSKAPMTYGFTDLPERVSLLPNAFGTIFSGENICLHVHYSPRVEDIPRNIHTFEDDFVLTCNTITGLNASKLDSVETEEPNETSKTVVINEEPLISIANDKSTASVCQRNELEHGPDKIIVPRLQETVEINALNKNAFIKEITLKCFARIHNVPVEISVQKIVLGEIHYMSCSTFEIELRVSNLASITEHNDKSYPDFKIKFEFISDDPSVLEFKPKNGILRSKEVVRIVIVLRPRLDHESQSKYEECLNFVASKTGIERFFVKRVDGLVSYDQIKIFEAKHMFYSLIVDKIKNISAVCFVQFFHQKSIEYFGFDTGSLKLSVMFTTSRPNIILFVDQIDFGKQIIDIRHDQWLFVRNVTMRPVPLKISLPNPIGPFFCSFALNSGHFLSPGHIVQIKVSFTPEHEAIANETMEVISETTQLTVKLSGSGQRPLCKITPDDLFNFIILTKRDMSNNKFIFRVANIGETCVQFNVQLEWAKERSASMTDDEVYEFAKTLQLEQKRSEAMATKNWTVLDDTANWMRLNDAFDLGNGGGSLLRFWLDPKGARHVQVTFQPPNCPDHSPTAEFECYSDNFLGEEAEVFQHHLYAAKFNVHVGRSVLHRFYVIVVSSMTREEPRRQLSNVFASI